MSCRHPRVDRIYKDGGYTCTRCDRFVPREAIRRGLNARKRGLRASARIAREAGIENREAMHLPEDSGNSTDWLRTQNKSGKGYPVRLDRWLRSIPVVAGQLRGVTYTETPGPGRKARKLIVLDWDEFRDWFGQ